MMTIEYEPRK